MGVENRDRAPETSVPTSALQLASMCCRRAPRQLFDWDVSRLSYGPTVGAGYLLRGWVKMARSHAFNWLISSYCCLLLLLQTVDIVGGNTLFPGVFWVQLKRGVAEAGQKLSGCMERWVCVVVDVTGILVWVISVCVKFSVPLVVAIAPGDML